MSWVEVGYAMGSFAQSLVGGATRTYIPFVYTDGLGLPPNYASLCWSLFCIVNAVAEPYFGYYVDAMKGSVKYGKHLPWIVLLFVPWIVVTYMLWAPPESILPKKFIYSANLGNPTLFLTLYYGFFLIPFGVLAAAIAVNYQSAYTELFKENARPRISALKQTFSVFGSILAVSLPPYLSKNDWSEIEFTGLVIVVVSLLGMAYFSVVCLANVKVKREDERPNVERPEQQDEIGFIESVQYVLSTKYLFVSCLLTSVVNIGISFYTTTTPLYHKYVLGIHSDSVYVMGIEISAEMQNAMLQTVPTIVALVSIPMYITHINKRGPLQVWKYETFILVLSTLGTLFAWEFFSGLLAASLIGLGIAGMLVLPDILVSDAIDRDAKLTGKNKNGIVYGTCALMNHLAFVIVDLGRNSVLSQTGYRVPTPFDSNPQQSSIAVMGIRCLTSIVPLLCFILSYRVLKFRISTIQDLKKEE